MWRAVEWRLLSANNSDCNHLTPARTAACVQETNCQTMYFKHEKSNGVKNFWAMQMQRWRKCLEVCIASRHKHLEFISPWHFRLSICVLVQCVVIGTKWIKCDKIRFCDLPYEFSIQIYILMRNIKPVIFVFWQISNQVFIVCLHHTNQNFID